MRKLLFAFILFTISFTSVAQYTSTNMHYEGSTTLNCGSTYRWTFNKAALDAEIRSTCALPLLHQLVLEPIVRILDPNTNNEGPAQVTFMLNEDGDNYYVDVTFPCVCGTSCYQVQLYFFPIKWGGWLVGGPYQGSDCPESFAWRKDFTICGNPPTPCNCITTTLYTDCDNSSCVKFTNTCESACLCVTLTHSDNTTSKHIIHVGANSFTKLCTGKTITAVSYTTTTCPSCNLGGRAAPVTPTAVQTLSLFPNPSTGIVNIAGLPKVLVDYSYNIVTYDGKVVQQGTLNSNQLNTSELPKGVYLIQILSKGQKIYSGKIVR